MNRALTRRQEAEAIEQFGDDILKALKALDRSISAPAFDRWNAIPHVEHLDGIVEAIRQLGAQMSAECDAAEEADDRRRDNPLEPGFRRIGQ